eukprot:20609-Pyramimonas_sp.AAC.1
MRSPARLEYVSSSNRRPCNCVAARSPRRPIMQSDSDFEPRAQNFGEKNRMLRHGGCHRDVTGHVIGIGCHRVSPVVGGGGARACGIVAIPDKTH